MSFQLVSTYIIISIAFGYTLYQFLKLFMKQKSNCSGSCGGCDFKNELKKRNISTKSHNKLNQLTYVKN